MSSSSEILIIGAGVLGLATAVELTVRGRRVTVVDPGGDNASSVAAGMIAPALECALENVTRERADLLRDHPGADRLSAGMSGDLEQAVAAGATHVRGGSAILGSRPPAR